jgi:hypothetical protein
MAEKMCGGMQVDGSLVVLQPMAMLRQPSAVLHHPLSLHASSSHFHWANETQATFHSQSTNQKSVQITLLDLMVSHLFVFMTLFSPNFRNFFPLGSFGCRLSVLKFKMFNLVPSASVL